jgi:BirA family biotin operon repressor/biotin-[acetyl-CoA-carboxylase] ligase
MKRLEIHNPWPGAPVYFKRRTASTMEEARRLLESGCPDGTVVLTDFQTLGRGRIAGRRWIAEAGKSLLFTLVLRTSSGAGGIGAAAQRLPLVAGLALAQSVEDLYGLSVQLKWPNDLLVGEKKLAGILCEALAQGSSLGLLVGIGLNCNQVTFPVELESTATSLARVLDRQISIQNLLAEVLCKLKASLVDEDWHAKVLARLYGMSAVNGHRKAVSLFTRDNDTTRQDSAERGVVLGLNPDGSLLFQPDRGVPKAVYGGEIRFFVDPEL